MIKIAWARKTNAICAFFEKQTSANKFQSEGDTHKGILYNLTNVRKFAGLKFVPKAIPLFNTTKQWQFSPPLPQSG